MEAARKIRSVARVMGRDGVDLTECYVVAIGFSGLTALSEHPVRSGELVSVELVFTTDTGALEGETVAGVVSAGEKRSGSFLLTVAFSGNPAADPESRLGRFIRRELGVNAPAPLSPHREDVAEIV